MDTIGKAVKDSDFNNLGVNLNKYIPKIYSNNVPGETLKKFFENTALNDVFADKLKFYMKANDITGKALAQKIGVTEGAVNKWANGIRFPKDEHRIINITDILGVTIADIMPDTLRQRELITKQELSTNLDKYISKDEQKKINQDYKNSIVIKGDHHNNHKINVTTPSLSSKEQLLLETFQSLDETQKDKAIINILNIKMEKISDK
jgi:transcriptional regulator with XRE-family HTH domain